MKFNIRIEGLSELADALGDLPKATSTNVQKRALREAAGPIQAMAQADAPVRTGALREKIRISSKLSPRQSGLSKKESKVEVYVGPPSMPRAIVAEFGSVKQTPKPFMRPAWDANKLAALKTIRDILATEIEKARQRAFKKTQKYLLTTLTPL